MSFYVTTPLYYVNDTPHIGHAYTTVVADVLNRFHKLFGDETLFLTGTDEHGQKVQTAAQKRAMDPQAHCDDMVQNFQNIWKELEIGYDIFFRTTSDFHKNAVQACLTELHENGEIYSSDYEGWYSVSEEIFFTEKELINGKSPSGNEVSLVKERNYFFKMSKYQNQLIDYIKNNPGFIQPIAKQNEVLGFLEKPLHDLNISRPKTRLNWGIELPFDKDFVTYVWFDALLNYAVAVGLKRPGMQMEFKKWWSSPSGGAIHLIGKDILTTHCVYWTTMLMALKVPLPKMIFAHGWWLTENNEKMSKSKGPTIKPLDIKNVVGVDGFRYFLARDISFGNDAQFSQDLVISRVNTDLANNLGNLLSRTTNLVQKYFDSSPPKIETESPPTAELREVAISVAKTVEAEIRSMAPHKAIQAVTDLLTLANKFLEDRAPWKTLKAGHLEEGGETLLASLECLRIAAILLFPVMPKKMRLLLDQIGWDKEPIFADAEQWGLIPKTAIIKKAEPLFPRIELEMKPA